MSTGTALVNARTPKAVPDEQFQGNYQYTPPEVQAYLRGEQLDEADLQLVKQFYGGALPLRGHTVTSQTPENYPQVAAKAAMVGESPKPTRLRSKIRARSARPDLETLVLQFTDVLPEDSAWVVLKHLAERFDLEVE